MTVISQKGVTTFYHQKLKRQKRSSLEPKQAKGRGIKRCVFEIGRNWTKGYYTPYQWPSFQVKCKWLINKKCQTWWHRPVTGIKYDDQGLLMGRRFYCGLVVPEAKSPFCRREGRKMGSPSRKGERILGQEA